MTELFYAAKCVDKQYVNEAPNGLVISKEFLFIILKGINVFRNRNLEYLRA